jgi:hypothetical protein
MTKKDKEFEELTKNIDWNRIALTVIPLLQPILIFGAWLGFSKLDKRADAVSKLIAIAEPIPTIDLNLPRPVVLASLYHSVDEALDVLTDVIDFLKDIEVPSAKEIVEEVKEEVKETVIGETPDDTKFNSDLLACYNNARKNVPKFPFAPQSQTAIVLWTLSCMYRKGYSASQITKEAIERRFF